MAAFNAGGGAYVGKTGGALRLRQGAPGKQDYLQD